MTRTTEIERRIVHTAGTVVPAAYLVGILTWEQTRLVVGTGVVIAVLLEAIRLSIGLEWRIFDRLTRSYEVSNLAGYALYIFGAATVIFLFEPVISVPAVLMLTIADPISGIIGSDELQPIKNPRVLIVMFCVCLGIAVPFVPLPAAVAGATVATMADGIKPVIAGSVIDDNLTIPIGAAIAMFIVREYSPVAM